MNTVKERPVLFGSEMVRAILCENRPKTQTRRLNGLEKINEHPNEWQFIAVFQDGYARFSNKQTGQEVTLKCPYGGYGDRLWVRETFRYNLDKSTDSLGIYYVADRHIAFTTLSYRIDGYPVLLIDTNRVYPSIHMPRWASRIMLEITNIRIQRIQGISRDDIHAEGVGLPPSPRFSPTPGFSELHHEFADLWDSIYAKRGHGWDKNDWVWVIEFKRVEAK